MKEENNIEKLFQGAFENFEVTPPVSVKKEIDKQLGTKRSKRRWIFWWSTILVLLLTGAAFAVINSGLVASSVPGLPASDDANAHSKTGGNNSVEKNTPVSAEADQQSDQSELKHQNKTADRIDPPDPEKQKSANQTGGTRFSRVEKSNENEHSDSPGENTMKTNSKKGKAYSVKNSKETSSKQTKQKALQAKNNGGGSLQKNSLKTPLRRKTAFSARKNNSIAKNKEMTGSEGNKAEVPTIENKQLPDAKDNQKEGSTEPKAEKGEIGQAKTEPADSIANVASSADSTAKPESVPSISKPLKDDSKDRNWMVEIYGGPRFGVKTSKTDFTLKSADAYQIGLGFSRSVNLGPLKYVTLDGEYGAGKESYRRETTTSSVYLVGIDSIPILDTTMTDTLGYTYQNNYDTLNQTIEENSNSQITRFAFGLKVQLNFNLGSGFGLAVSPGYYYSRSKFKFSDSSGTSSSSSSQILLNLSVSYDWNRFRFRVGLDSRYELMGKNQNAYIDRRKSVLFSPKFGVGFKF